MSRFAFAAALGLSAVALPVVAQQAALPGAPRKAPGADAGTGVVPKRAPIDGVLVLYGNERCPTDDNGAEVVVCVRRSADEQYRVPKELREFQVTPENAAWAAKAQGTVNEGVGGDTIGSCSTIGVGGQSGCFAQQARAYRQARDAQKAEAARVP